jgi:uncharacterized repeat protein (TIGR03803 family)
MFALANGRFGDLNSGQSSAPREQLPQVATLPHGPSKPEQKGEYLSRVGLPLSLIIISAVIAPSVATAQRGTFGSEPPRFLAVDVAPPGTATLATLHSFDGTDGANPHGGLVQATNGDFYGTTLVGGANDDGTVFKITPRGKLTILYSFCSLGYPCPDGVVPEAGLVQAINGDFYGTTGGAGANGNGGTIFEITPSGALTTLYSFCSQNGCTDGSSPEAALIQATNGVFYGTTYYGGAYNSGTVFSLSVGLGHLWKHSLPPARWERQSRFWGTNLTGATSVSFNGTSAVFTVVSSSEIKTTVPTGATTGTVQVTTPGGVPSSNVPFRVRP